MPASRSVTSRSVTRSASRIGAVIRPASGERVPVTPSTRSIARRASSTSAGSASRSCRVEVPTEALSSSAVPSATTLPLSMTAMRSASWSASSRYWVVSSTVEPVATSPRIVSHIWARVRGSRPVVGSSRKISGGCAMRLAARSRRRRMPPEKFFSGAWRPPRSGRTARAVRRTCALASARDRPSSREKMTRFSVAERVSSTDAYWPVTPISWRTICGSLDDVVAEDLGPAAVGAQQGGEHADGGGLAGAVRAEHAVDGAGANGQVDAVDGAVVAEDLDEALGLHRGCGAVRWSHWDCLSVQYQPAAEALSPGCHCTVAAVTAPLRRCHRTAAGRPGSVNTTVVGIVKCDVCRHFDRYITR